MPDGPSNKQLKAEQSRQCSVYLLECSQGVPDHLGVYLGWLAGFFALPDDFLFGAFAGAAAAASDMMKLSLIDSHKAQKNSELVKLTRRPPTSMYSLLKDNDASDRISPQSDSESRMTRGYKAKARTLLRRQQLHVRSGRHFSPPMTSNCVCVLYFSLQLCLLRLSVQIAIILSSSHEVLPVLENSCKASDAYCRCSMTV